MPNAHQILIGIALVRAIVGIIKPAWPLVPIAVVLIAVDLLTR